LSDCLNLFRAPGESSSGSGGSTFLYRSHPSKPNDTLMAINYAFMLGKALIGEPMFADASLQVRLEQALRSNLGFEIMNLPGAISGWQHQDRGLPSQDGFGHSRLSNSLLNPGSLRG